MPIMARTRAQNYDPYSDWGVNPKGQQVNAMGQRKIIGYSPDRTPSRGFGGLNEHYARQNYGGTRQAIDNFANDARKAGELVGKDGGRMLDTWENRGYKTHLSDQNPYAAPAAPAAPDAVAAAGAGVNNKDFANQPAPKGAVDEGVIVGEGDGPEVDGTGETGDEEGDDEEGGGGGGGEPAPQPEPDTPFSRLTKFANTIPVAAPADGTLKPPTPAQPLRSAASPYSFEDGDSPSTPPVAARVSTPAMASGDSGWPVSGYGGGGDIPDPQQPPARAATSPYQAPATPPPAAPSSTTAPVSPFQARADEIAAQRDFDRGEQPVMYDRPGNGVSQDGQGLMVPSPIRATKMNPYGTATATYGGLPNGGGTMKDPLTGNTVPIKQWTSQQSAVQDTKYGPGAAQAGEDYFNPKKIAASTVPLGQDDAEQYRAIARGGKIPRSSNA